MQKVSSILHQRPLNPLPRPEPGPLPRQIPQKDPRPPVQPVDVHVVLPDAPGLEGDALIGDDLGPGAVDAGDAPPTGVFLGDALLQEIDAADGELEVLELVFCHFADERHGNDFLWVVFGAYGVCCVRAKHLTMRV